MGSAIRVSQPLHELRVSGAASVSGGYTGTPDVTMRCQVIGNPLANGFCRYFRPFSVFFLDTGCF
jgi:hypothetical protein